MPPPYVARIVRQEAANPPSVSPDQQNVRPVELVGHQKAPDPPRYGDTPTRMARMPLYQAVDKLRWRAVMYNAQAGVIGNREFKMLIQSPRGKALAWQERANIATRTGESYGVNFAVSPQEQTDEAYRAMMGM
jgi:hypothetical protein